MLVAILAGIFLLAFCIFFHELGHFLAGKLVGVKARVFSIGYGKSIIKKTVGSTTYQIAAFPLGGYVQFYGDDITKHHENIQKGDFFSVGPWKRILIALGGPFFSVLLGLIVIFALLTFGWQPPGNKIRIDHNLDSSPAAKALKDGDRIIKVDQKQTQTFEEVLYSIALAPEKDIRLTIERDGKTFEKSLKAQSVREGAPQRIGVRPYGVSFLTIDRDKNTGDKIALLKGDQIFSANNIPIKTFAQLRKITDANMGKEVTLEIFRKPTGIFGFSDEKKFQVAMPAKKTEYISLTDIIFRNQKTDIEIFELGPWYGELLSVFQIKGETYDNWDEFKKAITYHLKIEKTNRLDLLFKNKEINARVDLKHRGMLGLTLLENIEPEKANLPTDFFSLISRTVSQAYLTTKATLVGLYRIFEGKLSLRESASGPIKIFDFARQSVSAGWDVYWFLLANITIILGIMNLLPIPILDGGHILFYLIEAVYKPLPVKVIIMGVKLGFVLLASLGLYVICIDIWDVVIKRFY